MPPGTAAELVQLATVLLTVLAVCAGVLWHGWHGASRQSAASGSPHVGPGLRRPRGSGAVRT